MAHGPRMPRLPVLVAAALLVAMIASPAVADDATAAARPIGIRVRWGGGTARAWSGRLSVAPAGRPVDAVPALPITWRTLCTEPDAAALTHDAGGGIRVAQTRPIGNDGVEITVADWPRARLLVELASAGNAGDTIRLDVPLAEILVAPVQRPLDDDGNRLVVEHAPGDQLRVAFVDRPSDPPGAAATQTAVRRPGDVFRLRVDPLLATKAGEGDFELRLRLTEARRAEVIDVQTTALTPVALPTSTDAASFAAARLPTSFAAALFEVSLPARAGVYEVTLEAVARGGLRWTRSLASRTLQLVADDETAAAVPGDDAAWEMVYELDPGSPKLHERLRRLPSKGLPAVGVPTINLPAMPLPSLSRPKVPLPRLPDVPLPNVAAMVPRFGGLLATGHSVVVPHDHGPMLRLPPATQAGEPTWEGIVLANVQPGRPHVVEIEYPAGPRAAVAVCVLETDATAATVEVRHAGGFEAVEPTAGRLERHRFVFWPTTRNPLLVLANPDAVPALVGRVRVTAGPSRLPPARRPAGPATSTHVGRATFALVQTPDLHRRFGGATHVAAGGGRPVVDWVAHLDGIRHSAAAISAGGLAGGVVAVYGDGAAVWPTGLTRQAPRWDPAAAGDSSLDPVPKDVLGSLAIEYGRAGLAFVPAFSFDAAIPALEDALAGDADPGIACVGADGRPRPVAGGTHYNILDPRVQRAVEEIVLEAASRLAGSPATRGVALLLPHDGWLHLPGVSWALDDTTFGRFLAAIDEPDGPDGDTRHAERARLVSGPLREQWLGWRAAEVAAFHARLAERLASIDPRWPLYVVPTTLFTAGEMASRFRPRLAEADGVEPLREIGLSIAPPSAAGRQGRLVFMASFTEPAGGSLEARSTVAAANAALARAAAARGSRGIAIVSQPRTIDLADVVPHGPFGSAAPPGPFEVALLPANAEGDRALAETLAAADAEVIFDARAAVTLPESPLRSRQAVESLPATMTTTAGLTAPLVVRAASGGGTTRLAIVNAGPTAGRAIVALTGRPAAVLDATDGSPLPLEPPACVTVPLPAWGVRSLVVDGQVDVAGASIAYEEAVGEDVARRIEGLRQRLAVLESPATLAVLDNPAFDLGLDEAAARGGPDAVTGWELVEPRRGSLRLVTGLAAVAGQQAAGSGRGLEFASRNGLSTLRSNPFPPPTTGRIAVAAWLRIKPGDPQPPLRIAVEGIEGGREYYRFAAIGGLAGGKPLTADWSLFVLQVADLPATGIESMRVRFDLLGPGGVEIDDVRVFDLAFDAEERGWLARQAARIDHRFKQGDVGGALVALEEHWPTFLQTFVAEEAVAALARRTEPVPQPEPAKAAERQGMLDRVRGWWR